MKECNNIINYFAPAPTPEEAILRRIKGDFRRRLIEEELPVEGLEAIPRAWLAHDLSQVLKGFLQGRHPRARGGEDLPDLEDGEVEIARMSLLDSVHGEVTSLRARRDEKNGRIAFRRADEYGEDYQLPLAHTARPLSARQVVEMFRDAEPSPTATDCRIGFQSFFYPDLDQVARKMGVDAGGGEDTP